MKFEEVRKQLDDVYSRAIATNLSVKQNHPFVATDHRSIGDLKSSTIALKNLPYEIIYRELESQNQYHLKLPDGALMLFQYSFDSREVITKHRLGYFPCPALPSPEEAPELYDNDELYGDIILHRIVRFPIRFDFDPENYKPSFHAHSHMTLGQFDNCRIPASHPFSPCAFLLFVARNFYFHIYRKHQNIFEKKASRCRGEQCITEAERRFTSLLVGS